MFFILIRNVRGLATDKNFQKINLTANSIVTSLCNCNKFYYSLINGKQSFFNCGSYFGVAGARQRCQIFEIRSDCVLGQNERGCDSPAAFGFSRSKNRGFASGRNGRSKAARYLLSIAKHRTSTAISGAASKPFWATSKIV